MKNKNPPHRSEEEGCCKGRGAELLESRLGKKALGIV